ncbi:MAG: dihydropyrimidinase [Anaerolineae bacterium]|nr:dihydropyrimidinase [Anaerolineae bacterium]
MMTGMVSETRRTAVVGGQVVTGHDVVQADVLIEGERIAGIVAPGTLDGVETRIDAAGCYVMPGVVDAHTHIKLDTGIYQTVDNWEVGTRAAAFGGVTTVIDFANQIKGEPFKAALEVRQAEAADAVIDYAFHMVVLEPAHDPDALRASLTRLMGLGVTSIKLFTTYRPNYYVDDATILRIFGALPDGMIAMIHCENDSIVTDATQRLVEAGQTDWRDHAQSRPPEAEAEAVSRVLYLASLAKARVYIAHCSTTMAVSEVNRVRGRDGRWENAYCETCPQYVLLHDAVYDEAHPEHYILQPPLRSYHHTQSLLHYITAGQIDVLSTDSCDYSLAQKQATRDFTQTPGGLPGLETLLPLMFTTFHERLPLPRLVQLLSENPARLFGLYPRKGALLPSSDADLVIYDPEPRGTVRPEALHFLAGYTPYEGLALHGQVRTVLSRGEVIVQGEEFTGQAGRGRFVTGGPSLAPVPV